MAGYVCALHGECMIHIHVCMNIDCTRRGLAHACPNYSPIIHGKYVYSTLALGKEREIVKEETALTKGERSSTVESS